MYVINHIINIAVITAFVGSVAVVAAVLYLIMAVVVDAMRDLERTARLNPYSDNYVGHIKAREHRAPCLCTYDTPTGDILYRHILCPWHGR